MVDAGPSILLHPYSVALQYSEIMTNILILSLFMNLCVFSIICDDNKFICTIFLILGIDFLKENKLEK